MRKLTNRIYSFDEFRLDLNRGALFRGDEELKLRPKSFDVLVYLTENQGRLIAKNELIEYVWQGMAVTDDSLVQCLKDIRHALGDDEQQIIKTVPRRGYIFDKEVSENGSAVYLEERSAVQVVIQESEEGNENLTLQGRRSILDVIARHKVLSVAAVAIVVAVVTLGVVFNRPLLAWWFKPPSIAILPVVNQTGNSSLDYVSDGMTETIISGLTQLNEPGKLPRLNVAAQNTVFMFKGKQVDPRTVGGQLGVDLVLASQLLDQDGLRIFKAEIINVADGSVRWKGQSGSRVDRVAEFLEVQNAIPAQIAANLPLNLTDADQQLLTSPYTKDPAAYDFYQKGRADFRRSTPSGLRKSIEYYQQAIDLDPNFALAYWAMGNAIRVQGVIDERPDGEAREKAVDLFQKALTIDNTLITARNSLKVAEVNTWDWRAIETAGQTHPAYRDYLIAMGRVDQQLEREKQALKVNPLGLLLNFNHCHTLLSAGRFDDAIQQCNKTLNLVPSSDQAYFGPESPWVHLYLSLAYSYKEMFREAIAEGKQAVELGENSKTLLAELAGVYARAGKRDEAVTILNDLRERESRGDYAPALNIAQIYAGLGDWDQAFAWLDRAADEREARLPAIRTIKAFDVLRSDPRFVELLRRMNIPV